jgi:hypothetical protein
LGRKVSKLSLAPIYNKSRHGCTLGEHTSPFDVRREFGMFLPNLIVVVVHDPQPTGNAHRQMGNNNAYAARSVIHTISIVFSKLSNTMDRLFAILPNGLGHCVQQTSAQPRHENSVRQDPNKLLPIQKRLGATWESANVHFQMEP